MNPHLFSHASRWLVFAAVAIVVSYALRFLASRAERAGVARVRRAREAIGLSPEPPRSAQLLNDDTSSASPQG